MSRYLTNTKLSEKTKEKVERAAKASGMNVEYRDHPMPRDYDHDFEFEYYNPDLLVGTYGSIYTHEIGDHSKFWREYEREE